MTAREALDTATATLAAAGIDTPRVNAEWLLAASLDARRMDLHLAPGRELSSTEADCFQRTLKRRASREPLQQILGWEQFHGLRLEVTRDVLVPRPETELLAAWALELLAAPRPGVNPTVVDLGTGSGCLAVTIAWHRPDVRVFALDASPAAAAVARSNARALGVAARVRVVAGDLLSPLRAMAGDLIVANLPYLPSGLLRSLPPEVGHHEPRLALDGGQDGLSLIRRIVPAARRWLRPGGALGLETAGGTQAEAVVELLAAAGFVGVETRRDLAGVVRHVAGRS